MRRNKGNKKMLIILASIFTVILMLSSTVCVSAVELSSAKKAAEEELAKAKIIQKETMKKEEVKKADVEQKKQAVEVEKQTYVEKEIVKPVVIEEEKDTDLSSNDIVEIKGVKDDSSNIIVDSYKKDTDLSSDDKEDNTDSSSLSNDEGDSSYVEVIPDISLSYKESYVKGKIKDIISSVDRESISGLSIVMKETDLTVNEILSNIKLSGELEETYLKMQTSMPNVKLGCVALFMLIGYTFLKALILCSGVGQNSIALAETTLESNVESSEESKDVCTICAADESTLTSIQQQMGSYSQKHINAVFKTVNLGADLYKSAQQMSDSEINNMIVVVQREYGIDVSEYLQYHMDFLKYRDVTVDGAIASPNALSSSRAFAGTSEASNVEVDRAENINTLCDNLDTNRDQFYSELAECSNIYCMIATIRAHLGNQADEVIQHLFDNIGEQWDIGDEYMEDAPLLVLLAIIGMGIIDTIIDIICPPETCPPRWDSITLSSMSLAASMNLGVTNSASLPLNTNTQSVQVNSVATTQVAVVGSSIATTTGNTMAGQMSL